jgi:hypothetical protein
MPKNFPLRSPPHVGHGPTFSENRAVNPFFSSSDMSDEKIFEKFEAENRTQSG